MKLKPYSLYIFDWQGTLFNTKSRALYAGAIDLLEYLRKQNVKIALATGCTRQTLDSLLSSYNLGKYFDYTRTTSECQVKPHPEMVEQTLEHFEIKKDQAVVIGDTIYDIFMANNAKVDSIGVAQDIYQESDLQKLQPTHVFANIQELYYKLNPMK